MDNSSGLPSAANDGDSFEIAMHSYFKTVTTATGIANFKFNSNFISIMPSSFKIQTKCCRKKLTLIAKLVAQAHRLEIGCCANESTES